MTQQIEGVGEIVVVKYLNPEFVATASQSISVRLFHRLSPPGDKLFFLATKCISDIS